MKLTDRIVHEAGPPEGPVQRCARCGAILQDYRMTVSVGQNWEPHWWNGFVFVGERSMGTTDMLPNCPITELGPGENSTILPKYVLFPKLYPEYVVAMDILQTPIETEPSVKNNGNGAAWQVAPVVLAVYHSTGREFEDRHGSHVYEYEFKGVRVQ
jgi:hypothetical protein